MEFCKGLSLLITGEWRIVSGICAVGAGGYLNRAIHTQLHLKQICNSWDFALWEPNGRLQSRKFVLHLCLLHLLPACSDFSCISVVNLVQILQKILCSDSIRSAHTVWAGSAVTNFTSCGSFLFALCKWKNVCSVAYCLLSVCYTLLCDYCSKNSFWKRWYPHLRSAPPLFVWLCGWVCLLSLGAGKGCLLSSPTSELKDSCSLQCVAAGMEMVFVSLFCVWHLPQLLPPHRRCSGGSCSILIRVVTLKCNTFLVLFLVKVDGSKFRGELSQIWE